MNLIHNDTEQPKVTRTKEGDHYDRCPLDGCMEVDQQFHFGSPDSHRWATYHADRKQGGCGHSWSRTTKEGLAHNTNRGQQTAGLTASAERGRVHFVPSEQYRARYDLIDWSK